jgi:exopolysaccharide biosynthesis polyprenyl glycosylphosphotransferase
VSDPAIVPDPELEAISGQDGEHRDGSVLDVQTSRNGSAGTVANLHSVNGHVVENVRPRVSEPSRAARFPFLSRWSVGILDIAMLAVANVVFLSAHQRPSFWTPLLIVFDCVAFALMARSHAKASTLRLDVFEDIRRALTSTAVATMVIISVSALLSPNEPSAYDALDLWLLASVLLAAGRIVWNRNALWQRRKGQAGMTTLVIGAGHVGQMTARRLLDHPEFGLRPIGFLDSEPLEIKGKPFPLPVLGGSWDLRQIVAENGVDCVLVTFSSAPHDADLWLLDECHRLGVRALMVPRLFERVPSRLQVTHVGGLPLLEMQPTSPQSLQFALKYVVDRIVAFALLVLLSPLLLAATAAVALSLKRPILYRQHRVSLDGRHFQMLKFRTMLAATEEEEDGRQFDPETAPGGVEGKDRRTQVGAFLRRWSLDELPQLINVLKGEMSLVGPRPERPEYVEYFREHVRRYDGRLRTRAGITGWAQIHRLRGQTSIADRVEWDNYYIENFSLWLDLKIMLRTIPEALRGGAD